jgi:hypothetical protein
MIHGADGYDPWADYVPLCRSCHLLYDHDARYAPEKQAERIARTMWYWTPENRERARKHGLRAAETRWGKKYD